ncbi:MAG: Na+ dependent nucleoside transporter [Bacteroidales bacterium]|nr:Na+ dependent nucleoside transporter [Bacteroidales bacterium]
MKHITFLLIGITLTLFCFPVSAQTASAPDAPADTIALILTEQAPVEQIFESLPEAKKENPYKAILTQKNAQFSFGAILRGLLGIVAILFLAWVFSLDRKRIHWPTVGKALLIQMVLAVCVLWVPAIQTIFEVLGKCFVVVLDWTRAGSNFLFGDLMDVSKFGFVFAFQILPTIVFFSALTSLFFYLGILQRVVWVMAWLLTKAMKLSGAESLTTAGNIFVGQTEAPLMVKPFIPNMTKSELMLIMTSGMATMAGGVLAAYIGMLGGGDRLLEIEFAKHLLSASVMAAPGAIAIAKILKPQTEEIDNSVEVPKEKLGKNVLDAISNGTIDGLKLAANVAAMLLVFYAMIAGCNFIFLKIGQYTHLNPLIASWTGGQYQVLSLEMLLSYIFTPVIWLTGVSGADLGLVGRLLGEKLIMTEFVAYQSLSEMIPNNMFSEAKSIIMATYILCGFANFASVGIQIGGIGGMAPNKRHILSEYGFRALLGGTLVALVSAAMVGMFL